MSEIATFFKHIPQICSSCAFAAAATVFYKKTFREDKLPTVGAFVALGLFLEYIDITYPLYSGVGIFASVSFLWYTTSKDREWFKTAMKMDFFCILLFAILDARFAGENGLAIPYWTNVRIFVAAIPQFLRKPLWLKTKLQDIRSKLGPVYVLYVSRYALTRDVSGTQWLQQVANFAMFLSVFAGVFCRPDNSAMLDLTAYVWKLYCDVVRAIFRPDEALLDHVPYKTKLSERRYYHGRMMLCSFGCCAFLAVADVFFK